MPLGDSDSLIRDSINILSTIQKPTVESLPIYQVSKFNYCLSKYNFNTVEPLSKVHFGTSHFVPCRETVLFSEVENVLHIHLRKCPL